MNTLVDSWNSSSSLQAACAAHHQAGLEADAAWECGRGELANAARGGSAGWRAHRLRFVLFCSGTYIAVAARWAVALVVFVHAQQRHLLPARSLAMGVRDTAAACAAAASSELAFRGTPRPISWLPRGRSAVPPAGRVGASVVRQPWLCVAGPSSPTGSTFSLPRPQRRHTHRRARTHAASLRARAAQRYTCSKKMKESELTSPPPPPRSAHGSTTPAHTGSQQQDESRSRSCGKVRPGPLWTSRRS